jgi:hypothetical protein
MRGFILPDTEESDGALDGDDEPFADDEEA